MQFVDQGPSAGERGEHFVRASLPEPRGVTVRVNNVEVVVGMLQRRNKQAARDQRGDETLHQSCLAGAAPAGQANHAHKQGRVGSRSLAMAGGSLLNDAGTALVSWDRLAKKDARRIGVSRVAEKAIRSLFPVGFRRPAGLCITAGPWRPREPI